MPDTPTQHDLLAEQRRCGVCGHFHPLVVVCPYVKRSLVRIEGISRNGKPWIRTTETEYFERPEIAAEALPNLEDEPDVQPARKPRSPRPQAQAGGVREVRRRLRGA